MQYVCLVAQHHSMCKNMLLVHGTVASRTLTELRYQHVAQPSDVTTVCLGGLDWRAAGWYQNLPAGERSMGLGSSCSHLLIHNLPWSQGGLLAFTTSLCMCLVATELPQLLVRHCTSIYC